MILNLFSSSQLNQSTHKLEIDVINSFFVSDIFVSGARVLNCSVKNLLGYLLWQFATFSVDLGYKPPKKSGNTASMISCLAASATAKTSAWKIVLVYSVFPDGKKFDPFESLMRILCKNSHRLFHLTWIRLALHLIMLGYKAFSYCTSSFVP